MMKRILLLIILLIQLTQASMHGAGGTDTLSVKVYFREGYSALDPDLMENRKRLEAFAARLRELQSCSQAEPGSIRIIGTASPEGSDRINGELSEKRAACLEKWLRMELGLHEFRFDTEARGVDWKGLAVLVEMSDMPYREKVLYIIENTPVWVINDGKITDSRKRQLGMLGGGEAWRYMQEHFFPQLRCSEVEISFDISTPPSLQTVQTDTVEVKDTVVNIIRDTVRIKETVTDTVMIYPEPAVPAPQARRPFYMAVKTNMLYDAALVPNIGVEFHLGKGWTIGGNWMYAWWKNDPRHLYWRIYGGDLNLRKYFGTKASEKPLQGHHLGIYGQILTYDFELGHRGYLGDRWSWGAGIEYGYSLPVAKRLNIDFAIGVGYLTGEYMEYLPEDSHYVWQVTKQRHWIGPAKAEITLVWLLGHDNTNSKERNER